MIKFNGKKTLGWRCHQAAMRNVPRLPDLVERAKAIDYFKLGFAKGYSTAKRLAKQPK